MGVGVGRAVARGKAALMRATVGSATTTVATGVGLGRAADLDLVSSGELHTLPRTMRAITSPHAPATYRPTWPFDFLSCHDTERSGVAALQLVASTTGRTGALAGWVGGALDGVARR